jgi:hypothetical protein
MSPVGGSPGVAGVAGSDGGGGLLASDGLATDHPPLLLAGASPNAGVLVGLEGELEAVDLDRALVADFSGPIDLYQRLPCGADGKEQIRIGVTADGVLPPSVLRVGEGEAGREDRHECFFSL